MTSTANDAPSPPPDWDNVPFDVGCARCGHDLRGLSESTCPACNLEFDWADAVPIEQLICLQCGYHLYGLRETRCPECGESFTWDEVLRTYRSILKAPFEYRWRDQPVRSFVQTWSRALRPAKLWKGIDIHDPPQIAPLFLMTVVMLAAITFAYTIMHGIDTWLRQSGWIRYQGGWVRSALFAELPKYLLRASRGPNVYNILAPVLFWISASFLALMVFPQSMRLCKVRTAQILRVWAYALLPVVPIACVIGLAYAWVIHWRGSWSPMPVGSLLVLFVLAHATWSLRCGYKTYLRMPHGMGIAVASQIIAVLAAGLCELLANSNAPGALLSHIVDFFGLN